MTRRRQNRTPGTIGIVAGIAYRDISGGDWPGEGQNITRRRQQPTTGSAGTVASVAYRHVKASKGL
jgi:hypothetical protein